SAKDGPVTHWRGGSVLLDQAAEGLERGGVVRDRPGDGSLARLDEHPDGVVADWPVVVVRYLRPGGRAPPSQPAPPEPAVIGDDLRPREPDQQGKSRNKQRPCHHFVA